LPWPEATAWPSLLGHDRGGQQQPGWEASGRAAWPAGAANTDVWLAAAGAVTPVVWLEATGLVALMMAEWRPSPTGWVKATNSCSKPAAASPASYSPLERAPAIQPTQAPRSARS